MPALQNLLSAHPAAGTTQEIAPVQENSPRIDVVVRKESGVLHFLVDNPTAAHVTATISLEVKNLRSSTMLPYTGTFGPKQLTEAFTAVPCDPDIPWNYDYTINFTTGSSVAVHDETCVYRLPYRAGESFRVSQGYNGRFSHTGSDQYAIDWRMPEGTPVLCARNGVVEEARGDSFTGGASRKFIDCANYILVRHADGTVANYAHLKKGGNLVSVGQRVQAGDMIALSGNTGFSSGPHLHFCVFKTKSGIERQSIPIKFQTRTGPLEVASGKAYTALPLATPPPVLARKDGPKS